MLNQADSIKKLS